MPTNPHARAPRAVVERIAGWSAQHRKTAVIGWLVLVAAAIVVSQLLGTKNLPSYDPGQSGQAERVLARPGVTQPAAEHVLIAERAGRAGTFATDPQLRQAARQVVTALSALPHAAADITSPLGAGGHGLVSADGRSALVTFTVRAPSTTRTQQ
jgi:putative drug exporter of the RND superfamily